MEHHAAVIIRPTNNQFVLVDGHSGLTIGAPCVSFPEALSAAVKAAGPGTVWRQNVDSAGRPLGAPIRVSTDRT
jgi:hypothetical protein